MSTLSLTPTTEHNVTNYIVRFYTDASKTMLPNTRLAVINWKAKKDATTGVTTPARKSVCVDVPNVDIQVTPTVLQVALTAAFIDIQDEFIRTSIEGWQAAGKENMFFTYDDLSTEKLAAWYAEKATSGKLSGDTIKAWFELSLKNKLEEAFAAIPDVTDDQVIKAVADYKDSFSKLASPAWSPTTAVAKQLANAVAKADQSDKVTTQLASRLEKLLAPKKESLLLSL